MSESPHQQIVVGMPPTNEAEYICGLVLSDQHCADEIPVVDYSSTDCTVEVNGLAGTTVVRRLRNRGTHHKRTDFALKAPLEHNSVQPWRSRSYRAAHRSGTIS